MQSTTRVALDAMGGDNAPAEVVKGAVDAVNKRNDIKIFLVGQKVPVERELSLYTYPKEQIEIVDAPEVIEMAEPPVGAIRRKKQSSIVVGMNMVKNKEADAFVSAGSSGAVLVGGQVIVGRIKGIQRPPLAPLIPTERGVSLLIDCGERCQPFAGLWCQCGRKTFHVSTVCQDGLYLYGACCRREESKGRTGQYRCRGGER